MKRFVTLAGAVALVASGLAGTSATADPGTLCAGSGVASLDKPIFYPFIAITPNVEFSIAVGGCSAVGELVTASCGNSTGSGTLNAGGHDHDITFTTAGGLGIVTGDGVGVFTVVPDAANGESCVSGADKFVVSGAGVGVA